MLKIICKLKTASFDVVLFFIFKLIVVYLPKIKNDMPRPKYNIGTKFVGSLTDHIDCYTVTEIYDLDIIQYKLEPKQERYGIYTVPESYIDKHLRLLK